MNCRFQIGSKKAFAKRKARIFCAASLPRKWSIRKICSSSNRSWIALLSSRALARSTPNGFSMMTRESAAKDPLVQRVHHGHPRLRRPAQVVQQASVAAECLNLLGHRARQSLRALLLGNKGQIGDELLEEIIGIGVGGDLLARLVRHFFAERLAFQFVE